MKKSQRKMHEQSGETGAQMTPVAMAIAQIGGTMDEVAAKLGTSRRTLYRLLGKGILNPTKVPHDLVCKFVELSGLKKEILIGRLGQSKSPHAKQ